MKKNMQKLWIVTILASVTLSAFGCSKEQSGTGGGNANGKVVEDTRNFTSFQGTHRYDVTEGAHKLVENGKSEYKIVIPQNAAKEIVTASLELNKYFSEATGSELPVKTDASASAATEKIISIGNTAQYAASGVTSDGVDLGTNGYVIKTVDDDVFLYGDTYGSLYSVFEFLSWQLGFDMYSDGVYDLDRNVTDLTLKNFSVIDVPDIEYRLGGATNLRSSLPAFRQIGLGDPFAGEFNSDEDVEPFHNWLKFIPRSVYGAAHPDWFSPDGTQLCLTRDFDGLLEAVTERCVETFKKHPGKYSITFTQMDGAGWCTHCTKAYEDLYGREEGEETEDDIVSVTAGQGEKEYHSMNTIYFTNALAKKIKEWAATYDPNHSYDVYMFSYGMTNACPVKTDSRGTPILDENGDYMLFDDELEISDNFGVIFCYSYNLYYEDKYDVFCENSRDTLKRWNTVTDKYMIWNYSTHFQNYFAPFNCIQTLQEDYQLAASSGAKIMFDNGQYDHVSNTDWGVLKSYLKSKLAWNVNADVPKLIDKFFNGYFGECAPMMKEVFSDYLTHHAYLAVENKVGMRRNTQDSQVTKANYPYATVRAYLDKMNAAAESISYLKVNDPTLYESLYDRIALETLSYRWIELHLYPDTYEYSQVVAEKEALIAECKRLGVTMFRELNGIDSMF